MTLALHYALRSDVGLLREGNEDSAYAGPNLLVIADGMGGHAAGEVASAVAVAAITPLDHQNLHDSEEMLSALANAVASASNTLHDMTLADPSTEGMGTTLTAMLWSGAQVAMCHIGDSRAYMLRDGDFFQITRDHTLVQSLVDEGRLTPAAAATHPQRSLVMRALQSSTDADPDLGMREALIGDRYLLCSDGLSDVVTEQTLHKTLISYPDPEQAVLQLIDLAIRSGGPDNITCIVADVVDTVTGPVAPSDATMLAGAAANGDGRPSPLSDSPATRAHQLTMTAEAPKLTDTAELEPVREPAVRAGHRAAARPSPVRRRADPDDDLAGAAGGRHRWPIVSSILVLLIIVVGGGGYVAWRITQSQYYVGSSGRQVVIFRGVNESVAGLSLSSAYRHTGIPVEHVPGSLLSLPTSSGTLAEAQRTVLNIRHGWDCKIALAAVTTWTADKPVAPVVAKGKKPTAAQTAAINKAKDYKPKPAVPSFCPPQVAG